MTFETLNDNVMLVELSREEMEKIAMEDEKVKGLTEGKNIVKVIAVPNKLLNIVVK